jgi:fatty-acyl-CoA synthase
MCDAVDICSPNNADSVVMQLGSATAGAVLVNVNPFYRRHELDGRCVKAPASLWQAAR